MKKQLTILLLFCLFLSFSMQITAQQVQQTIVTGKVVDETGEALIGVHVIVKDQVNRGTTTDIDGNFSIQTLPYSTLIFTYIGFNDQEVNVADHKSLQVIMKSDNVIDEVIVTAAGAQRKITSTGAITTVDIKDLKVSSPNLSNSLIGTVAGLIGRQASGAPGENKSEFWIRGISTFGANDQALVLVDGFERDLDEISIEDIESFSVLKDASATAIYGSKGANGVILITTKRGKAGKININAKVDYGYHTRTRMPKFVDGYTYAGMVNEAKITRNEEILYTNEELDIIRYQLDPDLYPNIDWMDLVLRNGTHSIHANVNFDGGGSNARYFVSASYTEEGGIYKTDQSMNDYKTNSNYNRWNYRTNFDMDLTPTTLVSVGVSGFLERQNEPGFSNDDIWNSLVGQNPLSTPIMYSSGQYASYGTGNQTNPWILATQTGFRERWKNVAQINLNVKQDLKMITEGLRFEGRFALDTNNNSSIRRYKWPEQFYAENKRGLDGNIILTRVSEQSDGLSQSSTNSGERYFSLEGEFHYNRLFNNKHRVGGLLKYFQNERRTTVDIGSDLNKGIPFRNLGVSGRATYSFMDRYMIEFNFGYTGSETFKPGHQFGFFPAISGGWNIAEEPFIKSIAPWLTVAKIRYSYGEVGNDYIGKNNERVRFPYRNIINKYPVDGYNFADAGLTEYRVLGRWLSKVAADDLSWEVAKKHNLGLDINILNNLFSFTVDVFKDTREDIFVERNYIPEYVGIDTGDGGPWTNVGKMQSKGIDGHFGFTYNIGEVNFTLRGNMTYAKNEMIESDELMSAYPYMMAKGYRYRQHKGLIALGLFEDYDDIRNSPIQDFGGDFELAPGDIKYKDVNGDGVINGDDYVAIGSTEIPSLIYGMGLSANWKGIDFNIHFQGAGSCDREIYGASIRPFEQGAWGNIFVAASDPSNRWISREISGTVETERTNAMYPRLTYGYNQNNYGRKSTFWMRNSRYLRLKTLEVGYTIPKQILSHVGISHARIFFLGNNLALWDSFKLWDPELDTSTGQKYPLPKSFTFGLTFGF